MGEIIIKDKAIGRGHPVYVIGEIGINHNGEMRVARALMQAAADAGCDAVKFQKRTPEICVPLDQQSVMRDTPWGQMTYLEYRHRVEFDEADYRQIDEFAAELGLDWFASPWDVPSVDFLEQFNPPCHKVASACLTDDELLTRLAQTDRPILLSTGMSTLDQIDHAIDVLREVPLAIAHTTSTYPCPPEELNLRMIGTLADRYDLPVGYSGHERGLQATLAAVTLGAAFIERHITLDRTMWGSDQAASLEPGGLERLVRDTRIIEAALGDGVKRIYDSELPIRQKLRRVG